ncbi:MAG: type II toxin-antitoxin system VapC family toxin [Nitrospirae bacterium]|nr:type II toxin-antitoxin system VapC family toxin [Nitrospirota bacterium]
MDFKIVVDASVAIKWYVREEIDADKAIAMLLDYENGRIKFIAPHLFYYETANAVNTAVMRKRITEHEGEGIIKDLSAIDLITLADAELIPPAYLYARKYNISVYDASYLAAAKEHNAPIYTADRKFYDAVKGKERLVKWIGDYKRVG